MKLQDNTGQFPNKQDNTGQEGENPKITGHTGNTGRLGGLHGVYTFLEVKISQKQLKRT